MLLWYSLILLWSCGAPSRVISSNAFQAVSPLLTHNHNHNNIGQGGGVSTPQYSHSPKHKRPCLSVGSSSALTCTPNKNGEASQQQQQQAPNVAFKNLVNASNLALNQNRTARSTRLEYDSSMGLPPSSPTTTTKNKRYEFQRQDYEARRAVWEQRYGSVQALRRTFGRSPSPVWGDLDPETTRQLYHTLLPRSLLGLYEAGLMRPDELAPLAYQARKAAKEYARERCSLPARWAAQVFDGYRSFVRHGTFQTKGLSWEQLWDKYEAEIVAEECVREIQTGCLTCRVNERALADRIYVRILERSCATNQAFDKMLLKKTRTQQQDNMHHHKNNPNKMVVALSNDMDKQQQQQQQEDDDEDLDDLMLISKRLEDDVREILLNRKDAKKASRIAEKAQAKRRKLELKQAKAARQQEEKADKEERKLEKKLEKERRKALRKALRKAARRRRESSLEQDEEDTEDDDDEEEEDDDDETDDAVQKKKNATIATNKSLVEFDSSNELDLKRRAYPVLRILAKTRHLLRSKSDSV